MGIEVTVWGENVHEREEEHVRRLYPEGMHTTIAKGLGELLGERVRVRTATLQEDMGVSDPQPSVPQEASP